MIQKYIMNSLLSLTIFFLFSILISSCGERSNNNDNNEEEGKYNNDNPTNLNPTEFFNLDIFEEETEEETPPEDTTIAYHKGFDNGYETGHSDGYNDLYHGFNYDDSNDYKTEDGRKAFKEGFSEGYDSGFKEGQEDLKEEILSDPYRWESEDIKGFYVRLEGIYDSDVAEYYAEEYYEGEYFEDWGYYYAKTSDIRSGEYEIELGQRITNKLFNVKGTDLYIYFKWSTDLSKGDRGIVDIFSGHGTFYINPYN